MSAKGPFVQTPNEVLCGECPHERGYHFKTYYGDTGCAAHMLSVDDDDVELCPCGGFSYPRGGRYR